MRRLVLFLALIVSVWAPAVFASTGTLLADTSAWAEGTSCTQLPKGEATIKATGNFGGGSLTLAIRSADGESAQALTDANGTTITWPDDVATGVNIHSSGCVRFQLSGATNPTISWEIIPKAT